MTDSEKAAQPPRSGFRTHRSSNQPLLPGDELGGVVSNRAAIVSLLGPAFVAGVAYLESGNVAANITAGAHWQLSSCLGCRGREILIAWLAQYLSASLGIVTGKSLPEVLKLNNVARLATRLWGRGELIAMATDVAEVIGGAIALHLLWGTSGRVGSLLECWASHFSASRALGAKPFERLHRGLPHCHCGWIRIYPLGQPVDPAAFASGLVPRLEGNRTLVLAAAILGATRHATRH